MNEKINKYGMTPLCDQSCTVLYYSPAPSTQAVRDVCVPEGGSFIQEI